MADLPTLYTMNKTFYYNFFPTKEEEELLKSGQPVWRRKLVEIRDIYPAPVRDPANPWVIKKTLTPYEVASGILVLPVCEVFEHVFRYWDFDTADYVAQGRTVSVGLLDLTEERNPKIYGAYFQMMGDDDDCVLSCMDLIYKARNLKFGDEIHMYWDSDCFRFRLVSSSP